MERLNFEPKPMGENMFRDSFRKVFGWDQKAVPVVETTPEEEGNEELESY